MGGGGQGWAGWRTDKRVTVTAGVNGRETKWRGLEKWCGLTLVHPIQDHGRGASFMARASFSMGHIHLHLVTHSRASSKTEKWAVEEYTQVEQQVSCPLQNFVQMAIELTKFN